MAIKRIYTNGSVWLLTEEDQATKEFESQDTAVDYVKTNAVKDNDVSIRTYITVDAPEDDD